MATITFHDGKSTVFAIEAASVTGKTYQLKDFGAVEISGSNKGFFYKINSLNYTATQNTVDKPHVGTAEQDSIATTKQFEGTIDIDLWKGSADVTLVGTTTTLHAINPLTVIKQVVNGLGETYTGKIYVGCAQKANAANGVEDYADVDTASFTMTLDDLIFTSIPMPVTSGEIITLSIPVKFKSSTVA
jgi:hypothetical protein